MKPVSSPSTTPSLPTTVGTAGTASSPGTVNTAGSSALIGSLKLEADAAAPTPAVTDDFTRTTSRSDTPSNSDLDAERSTSPNPFRDVPRDEQPPRLSEKPIDISSPIDADADQLARLQGAMSALAHGEAHLLTKTTEGMLLLAHDGQTASAMSAGEREALRSHVAKLTVNELKLSEVISSWRALLSNNRDVLSFAQRVLRESYMQSTLQMKDVADRLRQANELRKRVREELDSARKTKSLWSEESHGEEGWVSDEGYPAMEVDSGDMVLRADTYDENELADHVDALKARASGITDGEASMADALSQIGEESTLSESERLKLSRLAKSNDDTIKEEWPFIIATLPSMNEADLSAYMSGILFHLKDGDADSAEINQLFLSMSPAQRLYLVSEGWTAKKLDHGGNDAKEFNEIVLGGLLDLMDDPASPIRKRFEEQFGPLSQIKQVTPDMAAYLMKITREEVEKARNAPDPIPTDGSALDAQRTMSTVAELEAYIERLEDSLNSVGEDAQLMNVDLQNYLQKAQQTMQTMSNLLKVAHDTSMAIIRNTNS